MSLYLCFNFYERVYNLATKSKQTTHITVLKLLSPISICMIFKNTTNLRTHFTLYTDSTKLFLRCHRREIAVSQDWGGGHITSFLRGKIQHRIELHVFNKAHIDCKSEISRADVTVSYVSLRYVYLLKLFALLRDTCTNTILYCKDVLMFLKENIV